MYYRISLKIVTLIYILTSTLETFSQVQYDTTKIFELSLWDLYNANVISATKYLDKVQNVPGNIYVISRQQIVERNYSCLRDLLQDIPQIIIQRNSSSEDIDLYSINGIEGNEKFLVLIDGIRVNSTIGADQTLGESYSLDNVARVEVVLGPASPLYGADAFVGVVNIITFDYLERQYKNVYAETGKFNTYSAGAVFSAKKKNLAIALSGKIYHSDEPFMPQYYPQDYNWYYYYQNSGKMLYFGDTVEPPVGILPWNMSTDSKNFQVKLQYKNFQAGLMNFYEKHSSSLSDNPATSIYSSSSIYIHTSKNLYAKYKYYSADSNLTIQTSLSGQIFEVEPQSAFINQFTGYNVAYKYEHSKSIHFDQMLVYNFRNSIFTLGFGAENFDVIPKTGDLPQPYNPQLPPEEQNLYYFGTDYIDTSGKSLLIKQDIYHVKYSNLGSYFQLKSKFEDLIFVLGGRMEYDTRYGPKFIPRVGMIANPINDFSIKLLLGYAYLAPSPHRAYQHFGSFYPVYDSLGQVVGLGSNFWRLTNPDLKPENIRTFEISTSYAVNSILLRGNIFYNELRSLIVDKFVSDTTFHGIPVAEVRIPVNQGSGYTFGGTISLEYMTYIKNLKVTTYIAYSYINGSIENSPLYFTAKHTVKSRLELVLRNTFSMSVSAEYRSRSYSEGFTNLYSPPFVYTYGTLNYKFYYNPDNKSSAKIYIKATNLLDARYYNVTKGTFGLSPQYPLRVDLGLRFWF